jgi:hypothetical protein
MRKDKHSGTNSQEGDRRILNMRYIFPLAAEEKKRLRKGAEIIRSIISGTGGEVF